jgi:hypothetical protein
MRNNITDEEFKEEWVDMLVYGNKEEKAWASEQMDEWLQGKLEQGSDGDTHEISTT